MLLACHCRQIVFRFISLSQAHHLKQVVKQGTFYCPSFIFGSCIVLKYVTFSSWLGPEQHLAVLALTLNITFYRRRLVAKT